MKQTVPTLKLNKAIHESHDLHAYQLTNWEEVDRWAFRNQPLWHLLTKENEMFGLTEEDRLRTLAAFYMKRCVELGDQYVEYVQENPAPIKGAHGEVWRYVGP